MMIVSLKTLGYFTSASSFLLLNTCFCLAYDEHVLRRFVGYFFNDDIESENVNASVFFASDFSFPLFWAWPLSMMMMNPSSENICFSCCLALVVLL